ncbi:MAG TPA: metallophosphoesterase [Sphingomicrobium sp.]|nr:metallophosphoesterase [Sphingomicrobium sp.]
MTSSRATRRLFIALGLGLLASCAPAPVVVPVAPPPAPVPASQPMGVLIFGDDGYHLDYLEKKELDHPLTLEQATAAEHEEWIEDKRPPNEFEVSPLVKVPSSGGYVTASGLMPTARAMTALCQTERCDAATMLGDNIYPDGPTGGTDGVSDAKRFKDILFDPLKGFATFAPDFRIYAALGNHDWRTSREAALGEVRFMESTPPFYMDGIIYRVKPFGHPDVELFVLDTEVLLSGQTVYDDELADDGSELPGRVIDDRPLWTRPTTQREKNMVAWLERSLRDSDARWKIVMAHHPIWSSAGSKFQEARVMRRLILPILCKYADLYLAGHEHTLELHTDSCAKALPGQTVPPLPEIVSGAASKQRPLNSWFMAHQARENPELTTYFTKGMTWGYAHLLLDGDTATVRMFSTPDDGSGTNVLEATQTFRRRSGLIPH